MFEQTLLNSADKSLLYGAVVADSLTNAVACRKKSRSCPTVASTDPPFYKDLLHPDQDEKRDRLAKSKPRSPR